MGDASSARSIQISTPSNSGGFGTGATNRGVVGYARKCGTGDVTGDAPRGPKGNVGRVDSVGGHPRSQRVSTFLEIPMAYIPEVGNVVGV